jgi:Flp pilus assembly pilin Flp
MTIRDWFHLMKIHARRNEGQTMAEYGVVLTVITIGIFVALAALGAAITGTFDDITGKLRAAVPIQ